ncbi:MAG: response regulator, partial [Planctomycetes bacterium]|nr:response regulator [Planctomycetota bacterium]
EDNVTNQLVASTMLKKLGHDVDVSENGDDAVKKVQSKKYDIVFMDCQMPVLDGWEATKRIRQMGAEFSALPIIALTANALAGDRDKCLAAGMNDYLSKPMKKQNLEQMMNEWAGSRTS